MTKPSKTVGATIALMLTAVGCHVPPMVSDTGRRGTWGRRSAGVSSIVAITEVDGRWYSRFIRREADGSRSIVCGWDGHCEERMDGRLAATYTVTTRFDEASGVLSTETLEERLYPSRKTSSYREEFVVNDGGRTLNVSTTDRDGQHFEKGFASERTFTKIANSVAEPPRGRRPS